MSSEQTLNTLVIGGGQAGLAAGYFLAQQGVDFIILDENQRSGDTWRRRWDSLRLFTPVFNNQLPGVRFPGADFYFPTKDEAAGYIEAYAQQLSLPIRHGAKVTELQQAGDGFEVSTAADRYHACNVIIATGAFHTPHIPAWARQLDASLFQLHSSAYHNPADVPVQNVVVVGAGNSGAEIALELVHAGKTVWLAGRDVGRIPADKLGRIWGGKPYWWFLRHVMTIDTPLGRKMRSNVLAHGNPLIRARREDVAKAGVEFAPRVTGFSDGHLLLDDSRSIPAQGVVWATGFKPDYQWVRLPIFDETGRPRHVRGVVPEAPGLYFVGLHFQTGLTSSLMGGVGEDARSIVRHIRAS